MYAEGCHESRVGAPDDLSLFVLREEPSPGAATPHPKIDHFVVLYMENRVTTQSLFVDTVLQFTT